MHVCVHVCACVCMVCMCVCICMCICAVGGTFAQYGIEGDPATWSFFSFKNFFLTRRVEFDLRFSFAESPSTTPKS